MASKVLILNSNGTASANDAYVGVQSSQYFEDTTEDNVKTTFRTAGTFSNLHCRVTANAAGSNTVITFRVNSTNVNQTLTIGAAATGYFEDTTNTDAITAGQHASIFIDRGGGSVTVVFVGAYFTASGNNINKIGATNDTSLTNASVSRFYALVGEGARQTTEVAQASFVISNACTAKNMNLTITANTRASSTTYRFRKNNGNGNQVITVATLATGIFEDTSNTDSLVSTDTANYSVTTGVGVGGITLSRISVELEYSSNAVQYFGGMVSGSGNVSNAARYSYAAGALVQNGSDTNTQNKLMGSGTLSNLRFHISTNGAAVTTNCFIRLNSTDTAITVAVGAGATGYFSDTTNTAAFVDQDLLNFKTLKSATSSVSFTQFSYSATYNSTFTPRVLVY
jgi:hypothetical protein